MILSGVDGGDEAYCTPCKVQFSVCHGGANDVCKHFGAVKHTSLVSSRQTTMFLSDFGFGSGTAARASRISAEEMNLKVQQAESLIVYFVSEHNLPF